MNAIYLNKRRRKGYTGTGYPWELTEKEILAILNNFPKTFEQSISENFNYAKAFLFKDQNLQESVHCKTHMKYKDILSNPRASMQKWLYLSKYLLKHPSLITQSMEEVIKSSELLKAVFVIRKCDIVPSKQEPTHKADLVITQDSTHSPLARQEALKLEITEKLIDKIDFLLDSMTLIKMQKASIGTQFKGLENLIKSYTMFKTEGITSNLQKINIKNLNVLQARELSRKTANQN
jgi:hypothetical protein